MASHTGKHRSSQSRRSGLLPSCFLPASGTGSRRARAERRRNRRDAAMGTMTEQLEPRAMLAVTPTLQDTAYAVTGPGTETVGKTWVIPGQNFAFVDTNQGLLKFSSAGLSVGGWSSPIPLTAGGFTTEIKDIVFGSADGTPFADGSILVYGRTTEGAGREWMRSPGYNLTYSGGGDGFVCKVRPNGSMVWGTYLGAGGADSVDSVTVAPDGSIYVLGTTNSDRGFVAGGIDRVMDGTQDAFMVKLSATGTHVWSTYLSPRGSDGVSQIFDTTGGFYVDVVPGGTTTSYTIEAVVQSSGLKRIRMNQDGQLQQFPGIVSSIRVTNAGQDFTAAPNVSIGPPASGGTQATAEAVLGADGTVASIRLTNRGEGYSSTTPTTVSLRGNGTNASATATITNGDYMRAVTAVHSNGTVVSLSAAGGFLIRQGTRFPSRQCATSGEPRQNTSTFKPGSFTLAAQRARRPPRQLPRVRFKMGPREFRQGTRRLVARVEPLARRLRRPAASMCETTVIYVAGRIGRLRCRGSASTTSIRSDEFAPGALHASTATARPAPGGGTGTTPSSADAGDPRPVSGSHQCVGQTGAEPGVGRLHRGRGGARAVSR
jgi:hypothetical protein